MLELSFLRTQRNEAEQRLAKRNIDGKALLDRVQELDERRRTTQTALDGHLAELNTLSKSIGALMKAGEHQQAEEARSRTTGLKTTVQELRDTLDKAEKELHDHLCTIPNTPSERVPEGRTPEENVTVVQEGDIPRLGEHARPHWELGEEYGFLHMDLGVKVTGAGFPVYSGQGARLQRALIALFVDRATEAG